ncbi:hypothetical protein HJG60_008293 [Phyllostomus discolor]|uniref:Uncharacterized protein n=1 Tax=Phyllostomus discolor TaxID=89673 RepID=A0A833Z8I0_9CHIR|nr:hypothetical protein HJG60_008293 [Phyllostomus discolor]
MTVGCPRSLGVGWSCGVGCSSFRGRGQWPCPAAAPETPLLSSLWAVRLARSLAQASRIARHLCGGPCLVLTHFFLGPKPWALGASNMGWPFLVGWQLYLVRVTKGLRPGQCGNVEGAGIRLPTPAPWCCGRVGGGWWGPQWQLLGAHPGASCPGPSGAGPLALPRPASKQAPPLKVVRGGGACSGSSLDSHTLHTHFRNAARLQAPFLDLTTPLQQALTLRQSCVV